MYFYSNEHGSRVYFDEMGPPWPKHPCLTASEGVASLARTHHGTARVVRPDARVMGAYSALGSTPAMRARRDYRSRFGGLPLDAYLVRAAASDPRGTRLWLDAMSPPYTSGVWGVGGWPRVAPGDIVFVSDGWTSVLDVATLRAVWLPAERLA